ncbi:hypothetical protein Achl_4076 (plasmid) [Pseudarthrobacter chlorophenolicus A6]|uniref:Uncharacterized protein n=1 Tax=Pseudarthrobacter chlorophenolicus (strain ATCC 700700 / DSM 12829 / CIP 107037 / JCM 12360 / KCTC 9906 / NCIMB 13794 / A6) TaxID=452863 RepID=B8HHY0_PSECP|nr:hypothetical protein Achl_4076 [Pseudarthrobacter chlorophenolicus A6]
MVFHQADPAGDIIVIEEELRVAGDADSFPI